MTHHRAPAPADDVTEPDTTTDPASAAPPPSGLSHAAPAGGPAVPEAPHTHAGALGDPQARMVRQGLLLLTLAALAAGVALAFLAVNDVIATWLQPAWVPVWRAVFAVVVTVLALAVLLRLTRTKAW